MIRNYSKKLEKLEARRKDEVLEKSYLSKSFSDNAFKYQESTRYALESMQEVDPNTRNIAMTDAQKIIDCLNIGLAKYSLHVEFRLQGSVETNTNIKFHSDIDILIFTKLFERLEFPQKPVSPYTGDTLADMIGLKSKSVETLKNSSYSNVDDSKGKAITISISKPKRKVDVVPANWFNSNDFNKTGIPYYRGVQLFDSKEKKHLVDDYPFLHIQKVNEKDVRVGGSLKKLVRLLKTLKADAETEEIKLSSFEITSIIYNISEKELFVNSGKDLSLLPFASEQLRKLIDDKIYRNAMLSPNGKELVFPDDKKVDELKKLKLELDALIVDVTAELKPYYKNFDSPIIYS
jgi:hypothetical protein